MPQIPLIGILHLEDIKSSEWEKRRPSDVLSSWYYNSTFPEFEKCLFGHQSLSIVFIPTPTLLMDTLYTPTHPTSQEINRKIMEKGIPTGSDESTIIASYFPSGTCLRNSTAAKIMKMKSRRYSKILEKSGWSHYSSYIG